MELDSAGAGAAFHQSGGGGRGARAPPPPPGVRPRRRGGPRPRGGGAGGGRDREERGGGEGSDRDRKGEASEGTHHESRSAICERRPTNGSEPPSRSGSAGVWWRASSSRSTSDPFRFLVATRTVVSGW